ncbi:MAG: acetyl-CoA carboxylase biotin carboxyl carrier protein subunit [Paludibacteraceae bacterium]|nr:acetyl-CoA carboxylase biotin carboxyl carrier protein subunit [Candidatus Physcocola equi]MCQ2233821.1 acetyl-CoA carboxylase biotin carboxyl carrier protein subunit [Paludibacteraceae bacterium]
MEVQIGNRLANVELISKEGNKVVIKIDEKVYDIDFVMAENGVCSILTGDGKSYNAELKRSDDGRSYLVNTHFNTYPVEIIDSQAKYLRNRKKGESGELQDHIASPMPGKVVKILVNEGDRVKAGTSVIVVEAMKMQSDYKVTADCIIKSILVSENEVIDGNQTLIQLAPDPDAKAE